MGTTAAAMSLHRVLLQRESKFASCSFYTLYWTQYCGVCCQCSVVILGHVTRWRCHSLCIWCLYVWSGCVLSCFVTLSCHFVLCCVYFKSFCVISHCCFYIFLCCPVLLYYLIYWYLFIALRYIFFKTAAFVLSKCWFCLFYCVYSKCWCWTLLNIII